MPRIVALARMLSLLVLVPLVLAVPGCSSSPSTETTEGVAAAAGTPMADLSGTWSGMMVLNREGGGFRPVTLEFVPGDGNTFTGTLAFTDPVVGTESTVTGTLEGDQFRFQESGGRYVWGTLGGSSLEGQVAWDGFEGDVYATLGLQYEPYLEVAVPPSNLRFLDLNDGDQVQLGTGPLGPQVETTVEVTGPAVSGRVFLQVDGINEAMIRGTGVDPCQVTFTWWPWRGNGDYVLEAIDWDWDNSNTLIGQRLASQRITVRVTDFPAGEQTIQDRFISAYADFFDLKLTDPVFTRFVQTWPDQVDVTCWTSAAYIGDTLYGIDLFDDGVPKCFTRPIARTTPDYAPIGRPAGDYRMLVVFVDYGNTGLTEAEAMAVLATAEEGFNRFYREQAEAVGASQPILQVEVTGAFLDGPTQAGQVETPAQIATRTGQDTAQYDFLVEVDLDAQQSVSATFGGLGFGGTGCFPDGSPYVNIFMTIDTREGLLAGFPGSVFDHELSHSLGWQHWWPNGDGGVDSQFSTDMYHNPTFPTRMFGWTDSDGDGVLEILDSTTPYGLVP